MGGPFIKSFFLLGLALALGTSIADAQSSRAPREDVEPGLEDHLEFEGMDENKDATLPSGAVVEVPIESIYAPILRGSDEAPEPFVEGSRVVSIPGADRNAIIEELNRTYLYFSGRQLEALPPQETQSLPAPREGYAYARVPEQTHANIYRSRFTQRPNIPIAPALRGIQERINDRSRLGTEISTQEVCRLANRHMAMLAATRDPGPTPAAIRGFAPREPAPPADESRAPLGETQIGNPQSAARDEAELRAVQSLVDFRPQSETEARILRSIANTRPRANPPLQALRRLFFFLRHPPAGVNVANQNYFTIVDYSRPSSERRVFVINTQSLETEVVAAGHGVGRGARRNSRDMARLFSNQTDSNLPSKGFMMIGGPHQRFEAREGGRRIALSLRGLQRGVNDRVESRGILFHDADYVSNLSADAGRPQGGSAGCVIVNPGTMRSLRNRVQRSLMLVQAAQDTEIDYRRDRET